MNSKQKDRILLYRLAYFFIHFKPEQKKIMAPYVDDFLSESPKNASHSKNLSKILDFMTQKVFKPIVKFGRIISRQSPQSLKRRRDKMKPSFLLLHASSEKVKRKYQGYLRSTRYQRSQKKSQIDTNGR